MIFNVEMLAFGSGELRPVDVPDDKITNDLENDLELIFHFGQNDFQNRPFPSVSAGDIIHYKNKKYLIAGIGFKLIDEMQYQKYVEMPSRERHFLSYWTEQ